MTTNRTRTHANHRTNALILFVETDSVQFPLIECPVSAHVGAQIVAKPSSLLFGVVAPGQRPTKSVGLSASAPIQGPLSAKAEDAQVSVELETVQEQKQWTLRATLAAANTGGKTEKIKSSIGIFDSGGNKLCEVIAFGVVSPGKGEAE